MPISKNTYLSGLKRLRARAADRFMRVHKMSPNEAHNKAKSLSAVDAYNAAIGKPTGGIVRVPDFIKKVTTGVIYDPDTVTRTDFIPKMAFAIGFNKIAELVIRHKEK